MENENKWEYDYSASNNETGYPNVGSSGMNTANQYNEPEAQPVRPAYTAPADGGSVPPTPPEQPQYSAPQQPEKPRRKKKKFNGGKLVRSAVALVLAAAMGFAGGFVGAKYGGGSKVVIQQVERPASSDSSTDSTGNSISATSGTGLSTAQVAELVSPSVVVITTEQVVYSQWSWYGQSQVESGAGSGVIISSDGYILTCAHVVSGASNITVSIGDKDYPATLVGEDTTSDIAVVKVDATGLSKSCWGDVQSALAGECCAFEPGVSMFDFGGQRPARVECMHLTPADVEELLGGAAGVAGDAADGVELQVDGGPGVDEAAAGVSPDGFAADGGSGIGEAAPGGCPAGGKPGMIALPVVRPYEPERGKPYEGARAGMFSYSSIAEDGGGFADFSVEDAADDAVSASLGARDADAATSLGTAFHRLAQLAALAWWPGCALERPDVARQRALERSCGLSAEQRDCLDAALERWFASDIAARVGVCESVSAEAPFLVRVGGPCDAAYLEGEIDLLACVAPAGTREQPAGSALVVDYKTGGSPAETAEQLHEKHLLQATCYAYAVLMEGYAQVECVFVRVEQNRANAPGQPQTVSYRFDAADAEEMGRALARAYHGHGQL